VEASHCRSMLPDMAGKDSIRAGTTQSKADISYADQQVGGTLEGQC
jgi:hypothetical protein